MKGYICTRQKCGCGGTFRYDGRRGDLFCEKCDTRTSGTYIVRMGKKHFRSFGRDIRKAEQHLSYIRCQLGDPDQFGRYDERDWRKNNPLGLFSLGQDWVKKKEGTRPPLTKTRMGMIKTSIDRLTAYMGDRNIKTITDRDLEKFYSADHNKINHPDKLISSKTLFDICNTLNEFFAWAANVAGCEAPRFRDIGYEYNETEPITFQQQQSIISWLKNNCPEPMIVWVIRTLCRNPNVRPGELIELQWKDIDLISGVLYIHKRKSRRKLKRGALKPKLIFVEGDQLDYLNSLKYDDLNDHLFVYTVKRSGVKIGQRIHSKVLNIWFKKAGKALGINTYLYAGTKHTTTTELRKQFNRQAVMDYGSGHRSDAFDHYDHSGNVRESVEMRRAYDKLAKEVKLKVVK